MNVLELNHVKKTFNNETLHVLKDISLSVGKGEVVAIIGPSGSGKSTLLRCATLLTDMDSGELLYMGDYAAKNDASGKAVYAGKAELKKIRSRFGLVFQSFNLFPHYSVLRNLTDAQVNVLKRSKSEAREKAMVLLGKMGLADKADAYPCQLSGGQQQRVAIARALSKRPDVLLLDEPLSNLDAKLRVEMREEIRRIQREAGITTVFVTHDQEEASSIADRVVLLRDGVLQQEDTARGLYENPVNLFAADFLGTPPINQLHGVVQNGRLVLDGGIPAALALPDGLAEGQEIVLAVRAESILPQGDTPAFRTTVLERYSLGKDELVRLQAGPAELRGLVPAELEILPGAELAVGLKKRGVFLFDAKTGVRYL